VQDFLEQFSRYRDLGHLEDGVAGVARVPRLLSKAAIRSDGRDRSVTMKPTRG